MKISHIFLHGLLALLFSFSVQGSDAKASVPEAGNTVEEFQKRSKQYIKESKKEQLELGIDQTSPAQNVTCKYSGFEIPSGDDTPRITKFGGEVFINFILGEIQRSLIVDLRSAGINNLITIDPITMHILSFELTSDTAIELAIPEAFFSYDGASSGNAELEFENGIKFEISCKKTLFPPFRSGGW
ncbi:MAG: hypothetical protein HOE90_23475 [Bacteriovoracaceae bacterium]|jgi:hypothetical protein|nr:hypothetical protein [Bacteriovoracaceae bacterium]